MLLVGVLALVLLLGGAITWQYIAHKQAPAPEQAKTSAKASSNTNSPSDPSQDGAYLVIKEWGVRVALPEALKGTAFYSLRQFQESYGQVEAADISSSRFAPECRTSADDLGLTVARTTTQLDATAPYAYARNVLSADGYWYHGLFGKDGCSKFLEGDKAELFDALYQAVRTVESY